jgi:transposase
VARTRGERAARLAPPKLGISGIDTIWSNPRVMWDGTGGWATVHPASIQDRDGGGPLLRASRSIFPFIQRVFADGGYAGEKVTTATLIAVEIVRKNPDQVGFAVNPRRCVVERFFAWIGRNRRLAKDFEATIDSARAFLYAASVMLLVRRIARGS